MNLHVHVFDKRSKLMVWLI